MAHTTLAATVSITNRLKQYIKVNLPKLTTSTALHPEQTPPTQTLPFTSPENRMTLIIQGRTMEIQRHMAISSILSMVGRSRLIKVKGKGISLGRPNTTPHQVSMDTVTKGSVVVSSPLLAMADNSVASTEPVMAETMEVRKAEATRSMLHRLQWEVIQVTQVDIEANRRLDGDDDLAMENSTLTFTADALETGQSIVTKSHEFKSLLSTNFFFFVLSGPTICSRRNGWHEDRISPADPARRPIQKCMDSRDMDCTSAKPAPTIDVRRISFFILQCIFVYFTGGLVNHNKTCLLSQTQILIHSIPSPLHD